jgi:hypothetical protein
LNQEKSNVIAELPSDDILMKFSRTFWHTLRPVNASRAATDAPNATTWLTGRI